MTLLEDVASEPFRARDAARAGLLLVGIGVWSVPRIARLFHRHWRAPEGVPAAVPSAWGPREGLALFAAFWLAQLTVSLVLARLAPSKDLPTVLLLGATALAQALVAGFVVLLARARTGGVAVLGLRAGGNGRASFLAGLSWLLSLPLLFGLALVWPWFLELFGTEYRPQEWGTQFAELASGWERAVVAVLAVGLVPVLEELAFRGGLHPILTARLGRPAGMAVTALAFAVLHDTGTILPIFALALLLSWVREETGRLAPSIAIHVLHNGVQTAVLFLYG